MKVLIPFQDDLIYAQDKEIVYRLGGRWSCSEKCYIFEQSDIEAYILCSLGQWLCLEWQERGALCTQECKNGLQPC